MRLPLGAAALGIGVVRQGDPRRGQPPFAHEMSDATQTRDTVDESTGRSAEAVVEADTCTPGTQRTAGEVRWVRRAFARRGVGGPACPSRSNRWTRCTDRSGRGAGWARSHRCGADARSAHPVGESARARLRPAGLVSPRRGSPGGRVRLAAHPEAHLYVCRITARRA